MKNKLKLNAAITTAAVIVCVILVNLLVGVITSKKPLKIDLTREKVYEFSEQTKQVVGKIDKELTVYALIGDDTSSEYIGYVKEYLEKYKSLSDNVKIVYVDPYNDPTFVKKFEAKGDSVEVGSIIVSYGDNFKVLSFNDLYRVNQYTNSVSIDMERKMTSAITTVTGTGENITVYISEGHDEYECKGLESLYTEEGYSVEKIQLGSTNAVAPKSSVPIIAAPQKDFAAEEIKVLDEYTKNGGQIIALGMSGVAMQPRIAEYFNEWGIVFNNDYIAETDANYGFRSEYGGVIASPKLQEHDITSNLISQKLNFLAPMASSISTNDNNPYYAKHTSLMKSSSKSWGETDLSGTTPEFGEGDKKGPLDVCVMAERSIGENSSAKSRILALSSVLAADTNGYISDGNYANTDFMLNIVSYMLNNDSALDIHAKQVSADTLTMNQTQMVIVKILLLYCLPLIVFIVGIVVWWRRRYK